MYYILHIHFIFICLLLLIHLCIYLYLFVFIFILYIYIYIYANLSRNAIVRLHHPRNRDSKSQEKFLAPSADKLNHNYDREC